MKCQSVHQTALHFAQRLIHDKSTIVHSFIPAISIAPLQVLYYSEALPTTLRILYRSFTPKRTASQHDVLWDMVVPWFIHSFITESIALNRRVVGSTPA